MTFAPRPKAVVVEDDVTVAGMVCYFLELQGITCFHAPTAESGWRTIAVESPAVAVIDQRLPGKDGSWLLERIREDERFSQLPVVLISGYEDADVAAQKPTKIEILPRSSGAPASPSRSRTTS